MRVHVVSAGMHQLAWLLRGAGHEVTGDLDPGVDLVIVGREVPADDPALTRARDLRLPCKSVAAVLREHFTAGKRPLAVVGATQATAAAAMCAWILETAGLEPGMFLEAWPKNFAAPARAAGTKRKIVGGTAKPPPFVVQGAVDPASFDGEAAAAGALLVTGDSPDAEATELATTIPLAALVALDARASIASDIAARHPRTALYALSADGTGTATPTWLGALAPADLASGAQPFDLYAGGSSCGRFALRASGADDVRAAIGAIATCAEGFGVGVETARRALASFEGIGAGPIA
jgi:UDP-N-acetylmuramate: L-alanyl-gamma-D-glutamyl-meso-diaminopimelate ligase